MAARRAGARRARPRGTRRADPPLAMPGRRRSRSRRRGGEEGNDLPPPAATADDHGGGAGGEPYRLEVCMRRDGQPEPMFDILVDAEGGAPKGGGRDQVLGGAPEGGGRDQILGCAPDGGGRDQVLGGAPEGGGRDQVLVPHVCARPDEGYVIRVANATRRHVACAVTVDGENALLRDGSLIVAPEDARELPGFLVSKNFVGKEYVKEYRDFRFGKPKVVEASSGATGSRDLVEALPYTTYGCIRCEVFEAVLDEEVDSDQELRGQTTFYRGAGLNGSFEDRLVPEGKKKHLLYSSVTVQGPRSAMANSTRGRWWIRGHTKLRSLQVRYREAHALMLLGVDPRLLGLSRCKQEAEEAKELGLSRCKQEQDRVVELGRNRSSSLGAKKEEDDDKFDKKPKCDDGLIELCDLTAGAGAAEGPAEAAAEADAAADFVHGVWSVIEARRAAPVELEPEA